MNLVKKILVVHADNHLRRRMVLALASAGYDVRAHTAAAPALAGARSEWFDLALIDYALPGANGFSFLEELKKVQPTVPLVMLVAELELPLIIRGIRLGLTDVLRADEDPRPLLRRVNNLLRPGQVTGADEELTPADLAAVERVLARIEHSDRGESDDGKLSAEDRAIATLRDELLEAAKARAALETKLERAQHEKRALEEELRTLLAQNVDQAKLQDELEALQAQREMAAIAQRTIEEKARQLADTRAEIAAERSALEQERVRLAERPPPEPVAVNATDPLHDLDLEWSRLQARREDLREEEDAVRQEAAKVRLEATQLARERRRWHEDLDLLQAREENLRHYEERLRRLQAELEAGQLSWRAQQPPRSAGVGHAMPHDATVQAAWEKLQRASELLEAEQAMFRDERMALQDLQQTINRRHEELRALEKELAARDAYRRTLPPPAAKPSAAAIKTFTRAPFALWGRSKS